LSAVRLAIAAAGRAGQPVDVVHVHAYTRPILLQAVLGARRVPVVWSLHGGLVQPPDARSRAARTVMRLFDVAVLPLLVRRVGAFVVLTDVQRDILVTRYGAAGDRVHRVANMVPADAMASPVAPAPVAGRLLALSRLSLGKRLEDLVAAVAADPTLPGADIVGPDGGCRSDLERAAAAQPAGRVRVLPAAVGAARLRAIEGSKVVVIPSRAEGQPVVALEALASGVPVVASEAAAGALPDVGVFRYPTGDVVALVRALHAACTASTDAQRRAVAEWARRNLQGVDEHVDRVLSVYAAAVGVRRRSSKSPQA
jgi:glycosyltransferase involved in cell wall biosynthesis